MSKTASGACVLLLGLAGAWAAMAQPPAAPLDGEVLFKARCGQCHGASGGGAPPREHLRSIGKAGVIETLTSGVMQSMASDLTPAEVEAIAAYLDPGASVASPAAIGASPAVALPTGEPIPPADPPRPVK